MMDDAKAEVPRDDTKRAVRQAILLNEYLLRRAWGALFIVLALSMFVSIFGLAILSVAKYFGPLASAALAMSATGSGLVVILWTFKRVRYAAEITHPEGDPSWSRLLGYRLLVPLWVVMNGVVALTVELAIHLLPLVYFLEHLGVAVYIYYALTLSFSKRLPGEALVAVGSLSLSSVASLALFSIVSAPGPYALLWGATIAAWISAGVLARTRPVPEFEEERTGLE